MAHNYLLYLFMILLSLKNGTVYCWMYW